jgi:hypothetical protein
MEHTCLASQPRIASREIGSPKAVVNQECLAKHTEVGSTTVDKFE